MDYYVPLIANNMYHIVSRATGNEKLFVEPENYLFFLKRFDKYITPVADTFAYALLPNHFHFLVQIKPYDHLFELYKKRKLKPKPIRFAAGSGSLENIIGLGLDQEPGSLENLIGLGLDFNQPQFVMQQFSNMLNSYTKSFNGKYARKGSLFMDYMRRVEKRSDAELKATIFYIHKNPVHHGYCKNITEWYWSSYDTLLSASPTNIERNKVIDLFGSVKKFIAHHQQPINLKSNLYL